jgi:hypothetical protein
MTIKAIVAAAAAEIERTARATAMTDRRPVILIGTTVTAPTRKGIVAINIKEEIN